VKKSYSVLILFFFVEVRDVQEELRTVRMEAHIKQLTKVSNATVAPYSWREAKKSYDEAN
jgi:hypothetical protein